MQLISHQLQGYAWGSTDAIPSLLGVDAEGPVAEAWFGAHPAAPSRTGDGRRLDDVVASDPDGMLGEDVVARFGVALPYLLKLIAAARPLSLQVHPHLAGARAGFDREEAACIPRDSPVRSYRDRNHKPELVYALTTFEAMCGFRAPRRAAELFATLDAPLAKELYELLRAEPSAAGIRQVFTRLLAPVSRPSAEQVGEVVEASRHRLAVGSPSPRADRTVLQLQDAYPGDPGVVVSLLLNPVTLQPGEAMFVPAGGVHAYLRGLGVEIMASSDNVLRAGLTPKHVDVPELLENVDYVAAPPIRIAPEVFHGATKVFYAPVDDFELSVTTAGGGTHPLPGRGPRVLLCLSGSVELSSATGQRLVLEQGHAAFAPSLDGAIKVTGDGTVVQADVP